MSSRDDTATRPAALLVTLFVIGVVLVGVTLRFVTTSDLWLDEALTIHIAKAPLGDLQGLLERDGAPPLYYLLLHLWIELFGTGDLAVRSLSGVMGVAMLPLAYFAGRRLGGDGPVAGRRLGWITVVVFAANPYAIRYSTESRMYVLAMLLALAGYLAVLRALERPTLLRLALVAVIGALLLYTQYWALYLLVVVGAVFLWLAWRGPSEQRATAWKLVGALVAAGVLFAPWLPTFFSQLARTGTPWAGPTSPPTAAALALLDFGGGKFPAGNPEGWVLLPLLTGLALLALTARPLDDQRLTLDLRTVPGVQWEWVVGAGTLFLGITLSFLSGTAFQPRYAAVMFPLLLVAVAFGVTVFADRRVQAVVIVLVVGAGLLGGLRNVVTNRTQAGEVADAISAAAQPGDVVGYCPDQIAPATSRLLADRVGLQQAAWPDGGSPEIVDWVDYEERNVATDPVDYADELLERAEPDATIWLVFSTGYRTFGTKCEEVVNAVAAARPERQQLVVADDSLYEFMSLIRFDPPSGP